MEYVGHRQIPMKNHSELSEKWIQNLLVDDPSLLGLGEIDVKDVERRQPHAGRLDLLLSDVDTDTRYEVELQLGATDESHIIRTIEYWDSEKRRYPQYDHVAVIVAEEITARFFNVISLFNGFIPIIAIQVAAIEVAPDQVTLVFTKVLDRITLGTEDQDEGEPTDRYYWDAKASQEMLKLTDRLFQLVQKVDPNVELNYHKYHIGIATNGRATNFVVFHPQKRRVRLDVHLARSEELIDEMEDLGLDSLPYKWGNYRPAFSTDPSDEQSQLLLRMIKLARDEYMA